jgi:hypothetical protein
MSNQFGNDAIQHVKPTRLKSLLHSSLGVRQALRTVASLALVFARELFQVVDHKNFKRAFLSLQFQA